jgi:hypothetical protein
MNVYIKSECRSEFTPDPQRTDKIFFRGMRVHESDEGPYFYIEEVGGSIPEDVRSSVTRCSIKIEFSSDGNRKRGIYTLNTAQGVLDTGLANQKYSLRIWGPYDKDVRDLYVLIRGGLCEPKQDWDAAPLYEKPVPELPVLTD